VLVKEWPLVCTMYQGDVPPLGPPLDAPLGPVPILYAENVEAAKRALRADPGQARRDFLRLVSQMPIPRNIPPGEAAFAVDSQPRVSQPCAPPSAAETVSESGTVPTWYILNYQFS
jgi:hypothetical protein